MHSISDLNESVALIYAFISGHKPSLRPRDQFGYDHYIDVRDLAKAHVAAAVSTSISGQRVLMHAGSCSDNVISDIIEKHFPHLQHNLPKAGRCIKEDMSIAASNERMLSCFSLPSFSLATSVVDTLRSIEHLL